MKIFSIYLIVYSITLITPLSQLTSEPSTPRHVLYALPTPICCRFLVSTQRLLPWFQRCCALSLELTPLQSLLTFALVLHHILSVVFLKPTALTRPSVPPSGSHKCLGFGLWSTLRTLKDLLTYLRTCINVKSKTLTHMVYFMSALNERSRVRDPMQREGVHSGSI